MPKLLDLTYAHTLVIESTHKWPMDLVFINTVTDQSMDISCVAKLRHLSGSVGESLLIIQHSIESIEKIIQGARRLGLNFEGSREPRPPHAEAHINRY